MYVMTISVKIIRKNSHLNIQYTEKCVASLKCSSNTAGPIFKTLFSLHSVLNFTSVNKFIEIFR